MNKLTIYDYDEVWKHVMEFHQEKNITTFPGAFVDWDNTASTSGCFEEAWLVEDSDCSAGANRVEAIDATGTFSIEPGALATMDVVLTFPSVEAGAPELVNLRFDSCPSDCAHEQCTF